MSFIFMKLSSFKCCCLVLKWWITNVGIKHFVFRVNKLALIEKYTQTLSHPHSSGSGRHGG